MGKILWSKTKQNRPARKTPRRKIGFPKIAIRFDPFGSTIGRAIGVIIIVGLILFILISFFTSKSFNIKNFEVYGAEKISKEDIYAKLSTFENRNFFRLSTQSLKETLKTDSIYLKNIYIEKKLPDTVRIYIEERSPKAIMINYQGAFLLDSDGVIIDVLSKTEGLEFTKEEILMRQGYRDYNIEPVKNVIIKDLNEEEKARFDITKFDEKIKETIFNQINADNNKKIEDIFTQNEKAVSTTDFANFDTFFIENNSSYKVGDRFDGTMVNFAIEANNFVKQLDLTPAKIKYLDSFILSIVTLQSKEFVFTVNRPLWKQINEINLITQKYRKDRKDYRKIDVRSEVISVVDK